MPDYAKVLSGPGKFSVVQLPSRNYPGLVIQGDTLEIIIQRLDLIRKYFEDGDREEFLYELNDIRDELFGALSLYRRVCRESGIA